MFNNKKAEIGVKMSEIEARNKNLSLDLTKITLTKMNELSKKELTGMMKGYKEKGYIIISPFYGKPSSGAYGSMRKWVRNMTHNSQALEELVLASGYLFTPLMGYWYCGGDDRTATILETIYVVYNYKPQDSTSSQEDLNSLKELGMSWCKKLNLRSFVFVPEREIEVAETVNFYPAYHLSAEGKIKSHFNSVSIAGDADNFFKLRNKEVNVEFSDVAYLGYSGALSIPEDHLNFTEDYNQKADKRR